MSKSETTGIGPLTGTLVIDASDSKGEMCGRLLADLGACVIKIEPPNGVNSRHMKPADDNTGESLYWAHVGAGKQSVVADLETDQGQSDLRDLIANADIFVESSSLGYMDDKKLGYEDLSAINQRLVYISISPFGQTGPKANWPATDFTIEAAAGLTTLQGDGDRPPLAIGYPQASFHAGGQAAADAIIALNERALSGKGQHLDVSMQTVMLWTLMHATGFWPMERCEPPLTGDDRNDPHPKIGKLDLTGLNTVATADGYVLASLRGGRFGARVLRMAAALAESDGDFPEILEGVDFTNLADKIGPDVDDATAELITAATEMVHRAFGRRSKAEIFDRAVTNDAQVAPVNSIADLVDRDPQLRSRGFWKQVGDRMHPNTPIRFSRTPALLSESAPELGASNNLLREPIVFSDGLPVRSIPAPSSLEPQEDRLGQAFAGLKVADFSWVGVGPISAKALADHGATVVHIESATIPDVLRMGRPAKDGILGLDRGQFFANFNTSKYGIQLNLRTDWGKKIARQLIDWADVVVDSFTTGTMKRLGFDPKEILKSRPDLIWYSTTLRGQTGPHASFGGFGQQGSAIAGLHGLTGWVDRAPAGTWGAYTDFITPRFGVSALASAILERRASGKGQFIDLSQIEAGMQFIGPLLLDYMTNKHLTTSQGNSSLYACPNQTYLTGDGKERYIAISCETDKQWRALLDLVDNPELISKFGGDNFASVDDRLVHEEEINNYLTEWCLGKDGRELESQLITAGIPASVVQRTSELYSDEQILHRAFFETHQHALMGPTPYDGHSTKFSARSGNYLRGPGPIMGEHTFEVLSDILDMTVDDIGEAAATGTFT
jgi:crotonobetainyl-CoA:carnitine CoA-transferase CaiB-like acyl-CoA transferase